MKKRKYGINSKYFDTISNNLGLDATKAVFGVSDKARLKSDSRATEAS